METISFVAFESALEKAERHIRSLVITLIVSIILLFTSNMVWLYAWITEPVTVNCTAVAMTDVKASNEGIEQERKKNAIVRINKSKIEWSDLSRSEIEELIDEWIFSERDRKIIKRRLLDGICYEPLAEEFNMSVSQIKNIVRKCQKKLFF